MPPPDASPQPRQPAHAAPAGLPQPPAGVDALWAPWRLTYLESLGESENAKPAAPPGPTPPNAPAPPAPASFLAAYWAAPERDVDNHVIVRDAHGMILLNRYPYANGHLLVALGEGRPRLLDYAPEQRAHLWRLVDRAMDLMERALEPQGVNIGVNQGRAGGAGIPQHLHAHLVPRWSGDVNFMATVAGVRVIPGSLEAMAARYRRVLALDDAGAAGPG